MTVPTVDQLYELFEEIDKQKDNVAAAKPQYLRILEGIKGDDKAKLLSAQLIFRNFKSFPDVADASLDALFHLCENPNVDIRKAVVKSLPVLCKTEGPHVMKIGDVLAQLLQTNDTHEHQLVTAALMDLLSNKKYTQDILRAIFVHIANADEEVVRERTMKFLAAKLQLVPADSLTRPIEDFVTEESKKIMTDVTGEEFIIMMHILTQLPHMQTVLGRKHLLQLVVEQADLDRKFDVNDADRVDQVLQCFKHAVPYLSKNVPSTSLLDFQLAYVLPVLPQLSAGNDENGSVDMQLAFLQIMAELAPFCGQFDEAKQDPYIEQAFTALMSYLPSPPSESNGADAPSTTEDAETTSVKFSHLEGALYLFHQLCKKNPAWIANESRADKLKELRKRLQYLARRVQLYSSKLNEIVKKIPKGEIKDEKHQPSVSALRMTTNLMTLIKDLLHAPPKCNAEIASLSWKKPETAAKPLGRKISYGDEDGVSPEKRARRSTDAATDRAMYAPPTGRYSEKVGGAAYKEDNAWRSYGGGAAGGGGRGNNRGSRGGWRGRGARRGGRWY